MTAAFQKPDVDHAPGLRGYLLIGSDYHIMVATTKWCRMQKFKSVYFPDFPAESTKSKNLKLAFGRADELLWNRVNSLSSEEIRCALGASYQSLKLIADESGQTMNALCLSRLRQSFDQSSVSRPADAASEDSLVDPIQVTFRGGIKEPLQGWYPYLEGYSPEFVQAAIERFAPNATHVLDPFGGTGTTPLTAVRMGLSASYCELNPLLQFLIDAKAEVLLLDESSRKQLADVLIGLADNIAVEVSGCAEDSRLRVAYSSTFGSSRFFDDAVFQDCLRLRTWLDALAESNLNASKLAGIAVVSALIPASNLIRRGDVRFRKGASEIAAKSPLIPTVVEGMIRIAKDLCSLESVSNLPRLVSPNAKDLVAEASVGADVVVTSPPYLNGTNYYRNTKVELWFIRAIEKSSDLTELRRRTVTAGINDVGVRPDFHHASERINDLVRDLEANSYDARIPRMASQYFEDMAQVLRGLLSQTKEGAPLLLDIGDSAYSGVHVDTPGILAEMMKGTGWINVKEVPLRQRMSRSGLKLRQVLLVGERGPSVACKDPQELVASSDGWCERWSSFKKDLPHQKGEFSKRNWGSPLHSLCSYQGKMKPSIAKHLVEAFLSPGDRMLDVFTGVGTIPFEAASVGVTSFGFDISPAALPVANAKLSRINPETCHEILRGLRDFIGSESVLASDCESYSGVKFNGELPGYFHEDTFREVLLARRYFLGRTLASPELSLVFSSLLHVLHGNRPYALSRRSHPITPFAPSGEFEYKSLIEKVSMKVSKALDTALPPEFVYGETIHQDAMAAWPQHVDRLNAVITSPPFFDSTRFYLANWMRLWLSGWTAEDFKVQPPSFVDEAQKKSMDVYSSILRQSKERLRDGGVCVFHLGQSKKCDMAAEIEKLARPMFSRAEIFRESVEHCESHGIRDKGAVTAHTYLVLS